MRRLLSFEITANSRFVTAVSKFTIFIFILGVYWCTIDLMDEFNFRESQRHDLPRQAFSMTCQQIPSIYINQRHLYA